MVVETGPALIGAFTLVTLELRGITRTPLIVVLHASNTPALGLTPLYGPVHKYNYDTINIHCYINSAEHAINYCTIVYTSTTLVNNDHLIVGTF